MQIPQRYCPFNAHQPDHPHHPLRESGVNQALGTSYVVNSSTLSRWRHGFESRWGCSTFSLVDEAISISARRPRHRCHNAFHITVAVPARPTASRTDGDCPAGPTVERSRPSRPLDIENARKPHRPRAAQTTCRTPYARMGTS